MKNSPKHITLRIRSVVTSLILAGQILTFINLVYINDDSQSQNTAGGLSIISSDQLLNETVYREKTSRLKNLFSLYQDNFLKIADQNSKFTSYLDYYLRYNSTSKQQYSLHITQNHSLRSPPAFT